MNTQTADTTVLDETVGTPARAPMGLEEYYENAGPDYAAWSPEYNMHFGFFRWGMNPFRRERMLDRMNMEVLDRLHLHADRPARVLDLGCGLGATLRSLARRLPRATFTGVTLVPWQARRAAELNAADRETACRGIALDVCDYQDTGLPAESFDAVYAVESSCHAHGRDKALLLAEAHRLLQAGGRLVIADGFLRSAHALHGVQKPIFRKLCECWVIEQLGELDAVTEELVRLGFCDVRVERLQYRVAPSVLHIPWVTLRFLLTDVLFGKRRMNRARWNNVVAPLLLPLVGYPGGPMLYCMISATK